MRRPPLGRRSPHRRATPGPVRPPLQLVGGRPEWSAAATPLSAVSYITVRGVSREAVIADNGAVLTGELDGDDSMLYSAAAMDAARASEPAPAEVSAIWRPGYARCFGACRTPTSR